jgi:hypothetical protein
MRSKLEDRMWIYILCYSVTLTPFTPLQKYRLFTIYSQQEITEKLNSSSVSRKCECPAGGRKNIHAVHLTGEPPVRFTTLLLADFLAWMCCASGADIPKVCITEKQGQQMCTTLQFGFSLFERTFYKVVSSHRSYSKMPD